MPNYNLTAHDSSPAIRCDGCGTHFTRHAYGWDQWILAHDRYGWREIGPKNESVVCATCFHTLDLTLFN